MFLGAFFGVITCGIGHSTFLAVHLFTTEEYGFAPMREFMLFSIGGWLFWVSALFLGILH